jgi:hypothetical protein
MHDLLCLQSKHCCVAGDLYPILEQYLPPTDSPVQEGQSQPAFFVPRGPGSTPIERGWMVPSGAEGHQEETVGQGR